MSESLKILFCAIAVLGVFSCGGVSWEKEKIDELKNSAAYLIDSLSKNGYETVYSRFDAAMKTALPMEKLQATWESITAQAGALIGQSEPKTEIKGDFLAVIIPCKFEKTNLLLRLVFNAKNEISGFLITPDTSAAVFRNPPYFKPGSFTEKEVTVGKGEWALPGTLTLPVNGGPFPAVVLVHGSGPNDRDETAGGVKPFRDLAWGLAAQGIAVLRYEKRTKQYPAQVNAVIKTFTVKEETIDDSLAALEYLAHSDRIDPKALFLLGHSLGGYLVPRIAEQAANAKGFIIMAGSFRPMEDLILAQTEYLLAAAGKETDAGKTQLAAVKIQAARVKDKNLSPDTPAADLPLGINAAYWIDLKGYDPAVTVRKTGKPLLFLQGARDYQVTLKDLDGWKNALTGQGNAVFKLYDGLNHLFVEGSGPSLPAEYAQPGNVAAAVVTDIAEWIRKSAGR